MRERESGDVDETDGKLAWVGAEAACEPCKTDRDEGKRVALRPRGLPPRG